MKYTYFYIPEEDTVWRHCRKGKQTCWHYRVLHKTHGFKEKDHGPFGCRTIRKAKIYAAQWNEEFIKLSQDDYFLLMI